MKKDALVNPEETKRIIRTYFLKSLFNQTGKSKIDGWLSRREEGHWVPLLTRMLSASDSSWGEEKSVFFNTVTIGLLATLWSSQIADKHKSKYRALFFIHFLRDRTNIKLGGKWGQIRKEFGKGETMIKIHFVKLTKNKFSLKKKTHAGCGNTHL